jgi:phosphatidylethanolamine-binding protein (PEBP) family uncharacterized protein
MLSHIKSSAILASGALALTLAFTGCGGSTATTASTAPKGVSFNGKPSSIAFASPFAGSTVPVQYTCDGTDSSPPLAWGQLPPETKQLAFFILGFTSAGKNTRVSIRWAAAGISPTLHGFEAGKLPHNALLSSSGHHKYSLCPAKGTRENFVFLMYAIPSKIRLHRNFNASKLLGQISGTSSPAQLGSFLAAYARA